MRGSRKVYQRGSNFFSFFLMRGERILIPLERAIISPPASIIEMAFHWRADSGPTLNAGLVTLCFACDHD